VSDPLHTLVHAWNQTSVVQCVPIMKIIVMKHPLFHCSVKKFNVNIPLYFSDSIYTVINQDLPARNFLIEYLHYCAIVSY
jgi:hypothetical protein